MVARRKSRRRKTARRKKRVRYLLPSAVLVALITGTLWWMGPDWFGFDWKDFFSRVALPPEHEEVAAKEILVFFGNSRLDPEMLNCRRVYPVRRVSTDPSRPAWDALQMLWAGPTPEEAAQGYFTSVPSDMVLEGVTIQEGAAVVQVAVKPGAGVGGSCAVEAIQAQIEATLLQFPTVKGVVIRVRGTGSGRLEP